MILLRFPFHDFFVFRLSRITVVIRDQIKSIIFPVIDSCKIIILDMYIRIEYKWKSSLNSCSLVQLVIFSQSNYLIAIIKDFLQKAWILIKPRFFIYQLCIEIYCTDFFAIKRFQFSQYGIFLQSNSVMKNQVVTQLLSI